MGNAGVRQNGDEPLGQGQPVAEDRSRLGWGWRNGYRLHQTSRPVVSHRASTPRVRRVLHRLSLQHPI